MLRNFLKNRKAQNTMEFALLIALVGAGCIAMQTFIQRGLQANMHKATLYMANATSNTTIGLSNETQYEPYYQQSDYNVASSSEDNKRLGSGLVGADSQSNRSRSGSQETTYNTTDENITN